jgi:aldehyde dehydrogenase (NAD+)
MTIGGGDMTVEEISTIVDWQRSHYHSGATLPVEGRIAALKRLRQAVADHEGAIARALYRDLGKSKEESYFCETGLVLSEISYLLRHLRDWNREKRVPTPLSQFPSRSYRKPMPYGVTLIMSPWNYPLLLTLQPLADALAAGNTVVLKPSGYAPATGSLLQELLGAVFPEEFVAVIPGGREMNAFLLEQKFDKIFFTGSQKAGRRVLESAAKHLTPVTLEMGGKSPCIVHSDADLKLAARRIVFGKYLNCGQTCVAPDYILCHKAVKDRFIECLRREIDRQYGGGFTGRIVNRKHFDRICALIDHNKVVIGGGSDAEALQIQPTVLDNVTWADSVMGEEVFGPVLPVLTYDSLDDVIETVNSHPKPLALYIFSRSKRVVQLVTGRCAYGGGCVNDVVIHLATSHMGFGGVGESGMGSYHGKAGFDAFTHYKSMVDKKTWLDLPMRYHPYTEKNDRLVRHFLK